MTLVNEAETRANEVVEKAEKALQYLADPMPSIGYLTLETQVASLRVQLEMLQALRAMRGFLTGIGAPRY